MQLWALGLLLFAAPLCAMEEQGDINALQEKYAQGDIVIAPYSDEYVLQFKRGAILVPEDLELVFRCEHEGMTASQNETLAERCEHRVVLIPKGITIDAHEKKMLVQRSPSYLGNIQKLFESLRVLDFKVFYSDWKKRGPCDGPWICDDLWPALMRLPSDKAQALYFRWATLLTLYKNTPEDHPRRPHYLMALKSAQDIKGGEGAIIKKAYLMPSIELLFPEVLFESSDEELDL